MNGCGETRSASRSATSPAPRDSIVRGIADALLAVLLAPACASCGASLTSPTRGPVCRACWDAIPYFVPPLCARCGDQLPSWRVISVSSSTCARCRRRPSLLSECRAIGPYEGSLRGIVQALKYQGCRSLAGGLGLRLRDAAEDLLGRADIAVPVPLHSARQRSRGFNQAAELASQLGLPVVAALVRTRATPSQTDLPAARRHANVRGAFALRRRHDVRGLRVVVVDDVTTTGATLEACARVLIDAGATSVSAGTAARAVIRRLE